MGKFMDAVLRLILKFLFFIVVLNVLIALTSEEIVFGILCVLAGFFGLFVLIPLFKEFKLLLIFLILGTISSFWIGICMILL